MDELEQRLERMRLAGPSDGLDRRIAAAVAAARRRRPASRRAVFWWWAVALGAAGGLAALLVVVSRRPPPAPAVAIYRVEAQGHMRDLLLGPETTRAAAPPFSFHVNTP